jgi:hypothetical protein
MFIASPFYLVYLIALLGPFCFIGSAAPQLRSSAAPQLRSSAAPQLRSSAEKDLFPNYLNPK